MSVAVCGFLLFIAAFLFHVVIWRIKRPAHSVKVLVALFLLVLMVGIIVLMHFAYAYPDLLIIPHKLVNYVHIAVFFLSLFTLYLFSYSAIEADSPSLVIVMRVAQAGKDGLPREKIEESLVDNLLVEPRLQDLVDAKLVDLAGAVYKINKKGIFFIKPFIAFREFLGLGKGG